MSNHNNSAGETGTLMNPVCVSFLLLAPFHPKTVGKHIAVKSVSEGHVVTL